MAVLEILSQNLRYGLRALMRRPSLTIASVLTLSLGVGAFTAIVGTIDKLFFRSPTHVRDPNQVVRLYVTRQLGWGPSTNDVADYPRYAALRDQVRSFASVAASVSFPVSIGRSTETQQVSASAVTASFFPLLGVQPVFGRFFTGEEDRAGVRVAVLAEGLWRSRFANDAWVIGQTITVGNSVYSVIGVAPAGFTGVDLEPVDLWLPVGAAAPDNGYPLACGGCYWLRSIGRLRPGTTESQAASEATAVIRHASTESGDSTAIVSLGPIQAARGPNASENARLSIWIGAMSLVVLVIACANVTNLLLARALERQRENAVRLALGAGRMRLILEVATEGLVIGVLGGVAGLVVALFAEHLLARHLLPQGVTSDMLGGRVLGFTVAVTLATAMLISLVPAVLASRADLRLALDAGDRGRSFRRITARTAILVGQMALALVLVVGAGLFVRSFRNVTALPLGFDPDHLISVSGELQQLGYGNADINAMYERIHARVKRLPLVADASLAIGSPFRVSMAIGIEIPGVADSLLAGTIGAPYFQAVSADYFSTIGSSLLRGRWFGPGDLRGGQKVAVVNETMAKRLWPREDPIRKCIKLLRDGECREIVGIVQDVRRYSLVEPPTMQYYVPLAQADPDFHLPVTALLVRAIGPAETAIPTVRREIHAVAPEIPHFDIIPAAALFEWQLRPRRLGFVIFSLFGGLAVLLAAIGLYGVLAYMVTQRTRELGIRVALGAPRWAVVALVAREGFGIVAVGTAIGIIGAVLAGRLVASLLYGISETDGGVLITSAALLFTTGGLAICAAARRATGIDPVTALRGE